MGFTKDDYEVMLNNQKLANMTAARKTAMAMERRSKNVKQIIEDELELQPPKIRKKPNIWGPGSHHELQASFCEYIDLVYPNILKWATPNGGARNAMTARMLTLEGVLAGVPDMFIAEPRGIYHGMFVEFKVGYDKVSDPQIECMDKLDRRGYYSVVYTDKNHLTAKILIDTYLNLEDGEEMIDMKEQQDE